MNWSEIINAGVCIYESTPSDKQFRHWLLKKSRCEVSYYREFPLEDIDEIICSLLAENGNSLSEESLASILGFSVVDDFEVEPKRYADPGELGIFRKIINPLLDWGLINTDVVQAVTAPKIYTLSHLGQRALSHKTKYKFYKAETFVYEHVDIKPESDTDNEMFPFRDALGITSFVEKEVEIPYKDIDESAFVPDTSILTQRIILQSSSQDNIYKSVQLKWFDFMPTYVDIKVFNYHGMDFPIVFYNSSISEEATDVLNKQSNILLKEKKVEWAYYLKILNDPSTRLNYATLEQFLDIIEVSSLIKDSRTEWADGRLFDYISSQANANDWYTISLLCPFEIIEQRINVTQTWAWTILSERLSLVFIRDNITTYPWDFDQLSKRDDLDEESLMPIIEASKSVNADWDWELILPLLKDDFIPQNIDKYDIDLTGYTQNESNESKRLIVAYPQKRWDWAYISKGYEVPFLIDNIVAFEYEDENGNRLCRISLLEVLKRALSSEGTADFCASNENFWKTIEHHRRALQFYSANSEHFHWTDSVIDRCEKAGIITWDGNRFTHGFENNRFIEWSYTFFEKHHHKVSSLDACSIVSRQISDPNIIYKYSDFLWDWIALSQNDSLIKDESFVVKFIDKLDLHSILPKLSVGTIEKLFCECELEPLIATKEEWSIVTSKVSIEFVRKYLSYDWDWNILTRRFFKTIKIQALGNPKWVSKWDWSFLTQNLEDCIVNENLDQYKDYWDWKYLTSSWEKDFLLESYIQYRQYIDWNVFLSEKLGKEELSLEGYLPSIATCISQLNEEIQTELWTIITHKFSYEELDRMIITTHTLGEISKLFRWDYNYFYDLPEFNIRDYLRERIEFIDWESLSSSSKLETELQWDTKLFSESVWLKDVKSILGEKSYHWDFKFFSHLSFLISYRQILSIRTNEWDWSVITQTTPLLEKGQDFMPTVHQFSKYIDYGLLSSRQGTGVSEKFLSENLDRDWDWSAISENDSISLSAKFVSDYDTLQWNFKALSNRSNFLLDNDSLYALIDKDWDWFALSHREDLTFDQELIQAALNKPCDWLAISKLSSFIPNAHTLSALKGKELNWLAISRNRNLDKQVLWDYKDKLDWKSVTSRQIDCADNSQLEKYKDFLDWDFISSSDGFAISVDSLRTFKDKVNWNTINKRDDFVINNEVLICFPDVIDWRKASSSREIDFSEEIIELYRDKWDWAELRQNSNVIAHLNDYLSRYKSEFNCADFIYQFPTDKRCVYHFTHLFNAIDIINSRKILSRNMALGKFSNAAGSVVNRRGDAHNFARFYFRPQTPTQFYNECLGMDSKSGKVGWIFGGYDYDGSKIWNEGWKSYYPQAQRLGLPRCPMPVFFKFDLEEIITKMPDKCYYSTGNMQTNWAQVIKVMDDPKQLNMDYLYSTIKAGVEKYKEYSQQEFLVLKEFDFSQLDSFSIICYDRTQERILRDQLEGDPICDKISTENYGIYYRNNRELDINISDDTVSIGSDYKDEAYFTITGEGLADIVIKNTDDIVKASSQMISLANRVIFNQSAHNIDIYFVDQTNRKWLIYTKGAPKSDININNPLDYLMEKTEYADLFDSRVRHYTLKQHTELVCAQYEKYFGSVSLPISHDLMKLFLTLHDIGKPAAEKAGNRKKQYQYTKDIIGQLDLNCCGKRYAEEDRDLMLALADGDTLGEYFMGHITTQEVVEKLSSLSSKAHMTIPDFFYIYMVYYQCDTAAYTQDAGGLHYLEELFKYRDTTTKEFNNSEMLIQMNDNYWTKYLALKQQIV